MFVVIVQLCTVTLFVTPVMEMPVPPFVTPVAMQLVTVMFLPAVMTRPEPLELVGERNSQPFTTMTEPGAANCKPPRLVLPQLRRKVIPSTVIGALVQTMFSELPDAPLSRAMAELATPGSASSVRLFVPIPA